MSVRQGGCSQGFTGFTKLLLLTIFLPTLLTAESHPHAPSAKEWKKVAPYLIPDTHPLKPKLDAIFSQSRVLKSSSSMKKAGFINPYPKNFTQLVVTKHPDLKGYIIKAYLDCQSLGGNCAEQRYWIKRVQGADFIRSTIERNDWEHLFKVPVKWIYALPAKPAPSKDYSGRYFILVEDDMDIYDEKTNRKLWKSDTVSTEILDALLVILQENGLHDCVKTANIPFSKDGKIAFVDTQSHHEWPVPLTRLSALLSPANQKHWKKIIRTIDIP